MTKNLEIFKEMYASNKSIAAQDKYSVDSHMNFYFCAKCEGIMASAFHILSGEDYHLFSLFADEIDAKVAKK